MYTPQKPKHWTQINSKRMNSSATCKTSVGWDCRGFNVLYISWFNWDHFDCDERPGESQVTSQWQKEDETVDTKKTFVFCSVFVHFGGSTTVFSCRGMASFYTLTHLLRTVLSNREVGMHLTCKNTLVNRSRGRTGIYDCSPTTTSSLTSFSINNQMM
jgi:hypothetical protein